MYNITVWLLAMATVLPAYGSISLSLGSSPTSPQVLGTSIQWTATASDTQGGALAYQWQVGITGGTSYVVRDFYSSNVFTWTPTSSEGAYTITVTVMNQSTGNTASTSAPFNVTPLATGTKPVVTATAHPLVALYSAPACAAGSSMRVLFEPASGTLQATPWKACTAGVTMNFEIAGMYASTTYYMIHQVETSGSTTYGQLVWFTTGALPSSLPFPSASVTKGPDSNTDKLASIILQCSLNFPGIPATLPVARDLTGKVLWYYAPFASRSQEGTTIYRPLSGGTMLMAADDPTSALVDQQLLQQIDLIGNVTAETNVTRVSQQLVAMGQGPITSFSHDAIQLANGHIIALATNEELLTNVQGAGTVDVIGDAVVDLDQNLQVAWAWSAFNFLDTSRLATLGDTCASGEAGCPPLTLASTANDWLHGNSVNYSTTDGNLIVSLRSQDWVIKINYANGTGNGDVIWRLGNQGDFSFNPVPTEANPWFSHQHDAEYDVPGKPLLSLFDNGNGRRVQDPTADSRGQAYWLNESALTVDQVLNVDLGTYSSALGSAQLLSNGNFNFTSGLITSTPSITNQAVEVLDSGTLDYVLQSGGASYRNFRVYSMYVP